MQLLAFLWLLYLGVYGAQTGVPLSGFRYIEEWGFHKLCVPLILLSLSIHIFGLLSLLIIYSNEVLSRHVSEDRNSLMSARNFSFIYTETKAYPRGYKNVSLFDFFL